MLHFRFHSSQDTPSSLLIHLSFTALTFTLFSLYTVFAVYTSLNPLASHSEIARPVPLRGEIDEDELPNEEVSLSLSCPLLQNDEMLQSPVTG